MQNDTFSVKVTGLNGHFPSKNGGHRIGALYYGTTY